MSPQKARLKPPYLFAFLRAVNLGKHNKVPMKRLLEILAGEGFSPAEFILASGNLAFASSERADEALRDRLEAVIEQEFGVKTAPVFRTAAALAAVVDDNPFDETEGGSVHVALWNEDEEISSAARQELTGTDFSPDRIELRKHGAYLSFAATSHDSKLSKALNERKLGVKSTARNIKTLRRMLDRWPAGA